MEERLEMVRQTGFTRAGEELGPEQSGADPEARAPGHISGSDDQETSAVACPRLVRFHLSSWLESWPTPTHCPGPFLPSTWSVLNPREGSGNSSRQQA